MSVRASEIASFLGVPLQGNDAEISHVASLDRVARGALVYARAFDEQLLERLGVESPSLAIVAAPFRGRLSCPHVVVDNPRLEFARVVQAFFVERVEPRIAKSAVLGPGVKLGERVTIGEYAVIGQDVVVGDGTEIRNHVVIAPRTRIGRSCLIKSHAVLGEEGFGFEFDAAGRPVRVPHLGAVHLGDEVEIGAATVIARGTLDHTTIGDRVKIDDHVFIAHNVVIGENSVVIAHAVISGSVKVGRNAWIGPGASVLNKVSIGERAFIGIGAVVTKPVPAGAAVAGNPARPLPKAR